MLVAALLSLGAEPALAGDVHLAWDECGRSGQPDHAFACNADATIHVLVSSFNAPPGFQHFIGATTELEVAANPGGLPSWWHVETGGCRSGAVSSEDAAATGFTGCANPYQGSQNLSLVHYEPGYEGNPSRARVIADLARSDDGVALSAGTEYQANVIQIRSTRTAGCGGCSEGVAIVLLRVYVAQPNGSSGDDYVELTESAAPYVTWMGGTASAPQRKSTWGGLKSLYR